MVKHLTLLSLCLVVAASAFSESVEHGGVEFWVYRFDPAKENFELHLAGENTPNTFTKVEEKVRSSGRRLLVAMNSGIFEKNFLPSGLHVANEKTLVETNTKDFVKESPEQFTPNFYLKPNGVFFMQEDMLGGGQILETNEWVHEVTTTILFAIQSGPLLVRNGKIHPKFNRGSESKHYRNGIGVTENGRIVLACSKTDPERGLTNLHNFADLFRNKLDCPDALYLDGAISDIYIRGETGETRDRNQFAGIIAITEK